MTKVNLPNLLQVGDTIGIVAPSEPITIIHQSNIEIGIHNLSDLGFRIVFSDNISCPLGRTNSSKLRANDIMKMATDNNINAIMAAIGGYSSLEIIEYLDLNILSSLRKPFIGFSDITALNNFLLKKVRLLNYYGPTFAVFCQKELPEYTLKHFKQMLCNNNMLRIYPSPIYADDLWYTSNNGSRLWKENEQWLIYNRACFSGHIAGGNLETLLSLAGTEYMPELEDSVLFLEEANAKPRAAIRREIQQLKLMGIFSKIKAVVFGRFWGWSQEYQRDFFESLCKTILRDFNRPIMANLDFGHSDPMLTLPLGGWAEYDGNILYIRKQRCD